MELILIEMKVGHDRCIKRDDSTENIVVCRLWIKPQTCDFHFFVAVGSFTADVGLLLPTGGCNDNTSQGRFHSVNLKKEFAYRSEIE